jgi:hypothetical protein
VLTTNPLRNHHHQSAHHLNPAHQFKINPQHFILHKKQDSQYVSSPFPLQSPNKSQAMASQNHGLIKTSQFHASLSEIPIPGLRPTYILVRTIAVALNPTDWQTLDEVPEPGTPYSLLGCDAAGIVVEVGSEVTKDFKVGDRIAGLAHGGSSSHFDFDFKNFMNWIELELTGVK